MCNHCPFMSLKKYIEKQRNGLEDALLLLIYTFEVIQYTVYKHTVWYYQIYVSNKNSNLIILQYFLGIFGPNFWIIGTLQSNFAGIFDIFGPKSQCDKARLKRYSWQKSTKTNTVKRSINQTLSKIFTEKSIFSKYLTPKNASIGLKVIKKGVKMCDCNQVFKFCWQM